jgi:hypothetical protein
LIFKAHTSRAFSCAVAAFLTFEAEFPHPIMEEVGLRFINEPSSTLSACRETSFPPHGVVPLRAMQLDGSPNPQTPLCGFFYAELRHLHQLESLPIMVQ